MTNSFKLSPQALTDLETIYEYCLLSFGVQKANLYQDELHQCFMAISLNYDIGEVYYFKKGNYRKIKINRHLIFYKIIKDNPVIVRFLHERMYLELNI